MSAPHAGWHGRGVDVTSQQHHDVMGAGRKAGRPASSMQRATASKAHRSVRRTHPPPLSFLELRSPFWGATPLPCRREGSLSKGAANLRANAPARGAGAKPISTLPTPASRIISPSSAQTSGGPVCVSAACEQARGREGGSGREEGPVGGGRQARARHAAGHRGLRRTLAGRPGQPQLPPVPFLFPFLSPLFSRKQTLRLAADRSDPAPQHPPQRLPAPGPPMPSDAPAPSSCAPHTPSARKRAHTPGGCVEAERAAPRQDPAPLLTCRT